MKILEWFRGRRNFTRAYDQNDPYSLFVAGPNHLARCMAESDTDVRHLGRYLTYAYECPACGPQSVELPPDYPYCGPNSVWTCSHCAGVMRLKSPVPIRGTPKRCSLTSLVRGSH